ncbi:MAG: glycosyltransferase family 4 protein [Treponema sp.]|nr:glycosyltransferase family 4 protein [Treponema sp.]
MKPILINGNFLCRNLTGVERFAWEICERLDKLITDEKSVSILIPANAKKLPVYKNIKMIRSNKSIKRFPLWDMGVFANECNKGNFLALNFGNTAPYGKNCGIAFIHDIYAQDCPEDFSSFRDKLVKLYCCFQYSNICKNAKKIITVSNFSKSRIQSVYKVSDERISIIGNGWEHFTSLPSDETIFQQFPVLKRHNYYFTLGSLSKRKNLAWIAKYALEHPLDTFAISGKAINGVVPNNLQDLKKLQNVILLGYISDSQVKALMLNCKAFVFPSYYEGFGIPPLEALSVGAKIIISNSTSLPEIYKDTAHYFNADDTNVDFESLLKQNVESPEKVLNTYSYSNSASLLFEMLKTL